MVSYSKPGGFLTIDGETLLAAAPGQCLLGLLQIPSNTPAEKGGCFLFPAGSGNVQLPVQRGDAVFAA